MRSLSLQSKSRSPLNTPHPTMPQGLRRIGLVEEEEARLPYQLTFLSPLTETSRTCPLLGQSRRALACIQVTSSVDHCRSRKYARADSAPTSRAAQLPDAWPKTLHLRYHKSITDATDLARKTGFKAQAHQLAFCYAGRSLDNYIAGIYNRANGGPNRNRRMHEAIGDLQTNNKLRCNTPNALKRITIDPNLQAVDIRAFASRVERSYLASVFARETIERMDAHEDVDWQTHKRQLQLLTDLHLAVYNVICKGLPTYQRYQLQHPRVLSDIASARLQPALPYPERTAYRRRLFHDNEAVGVDTRKEATESVQRLSRTDNDRTGLQEQTTTRWTNLCDGKPKGFKSGKPPGKHGIRL